MMRDRLLTFYVVAVQVCAAALVAVTPDTGIGDRPVAALLLVGMAVLAGARPVRVASLRVNLTATHPFVFTALVAVGPMGAVLAELGGVLGAALGRRKAPAARHFLFNVGAAVIAVNAAWLVLAALGGDADPGLPGVIGPLAAGALAYFVVNSGLLTIAITLERNAALVPTWRRSCLWTFVPFFAGVTLAVAMLALIDVLVPWGILLALAPTWLLVGAYRRHPVSLEVPPGEEG